jgi:hypothetical protein
MATMKRRVIYLSDTEWTWLRTEAKRLNRSMSAHIRDQLGFEGLIQIGPPIEGGHLIAAKRAEPFPDRFNSQPFSGPIPKKR